VASGDVLFVAEDSDASPDEAVCDASPAIDVGSIHDEGVLYLGVADSDIVADAGVGADVGVWIYEQLLPINEGPGCGYAAYYRVFSDSYVVCYCRGVFDFSPIAWARFARAVCL